MGSIYLTKNLGVFLQYPHPPLPPFPLSKKKEKRKRKKKKEKRKTAHQGNNKNIQIFY